MRIPEKNTTASLFSGNTIMKDFKNINFDIIDLTVNATPDIYINKNNITFIKKVLEDLGYPANVQYCVSAENKVFAVRACKSNEAKVPRSQSQRAYRPQRSVPVIRISLSPSERL